MIKLLIYNCTNFSFLVKGHTKTENVPNDNVVVSILASETNENSKD